ncbi:ribosome small subunit-dependent GTPase A [Flagellimonas nanhaiensis]|uniref:Small ribosomal subunit biogenesis GTPase RsgA n=2 Tax=Flagellimonas nanhaiensis TaxID=2292706 RepID=A0A371JW36_9FLAO|nr:ribosome small subunit-dependent GTPase A [Allomuricauda nanhaiensis]
MKLEDLGYTNEQEKYRQENNLGVFDVGRIISEHKERYVVKTETNEYDGEIIGNLRFSASSRADFPAVGDWVAISPYDEDKVLIHAILPRKTVLERQAVGKHGEKQIIATNIDFALIMQAVDRDFNVNRIERYLTICHTSKVKPIIVLNKIDLISEVELEGHIDEVRKRISDAPILAISNESQEGIQQLSNRIEKGKTYCLLGSSGVGKSTLLNSLMGKDLMRTGSIGLGTNRGKHVTTHRELRVLENGGILIDNPGMREVGIVDSSDGLEVTFDTIMELSKECKFKDCSHTTETGCAVISAVDNGEIDETSYDNYLRMEREKSHFEMTVAQKRKKDKDFGKMVKNFQKNKNLKKY